MEDNPVVFTKDVPPDIVGTMGRAWKQDVKSVAKRFPDGAPPELTVASWIVHAPYAHPVWHSYSIFGLSLREHPKMPPAVILLPGATHEVMVWALNPGFETAINDTLHFLEPANYAGQVVYGSDEIAAGWVEQAVRDVVAGTLSPDTDSRRMWAERFSYSNFKGGK